MDPLGFALEHFDATGAWRDQDGPLPIDSAGKLPNGQSFSGSQDLKRVLRGDKRVVEDLMRQLDLHEYKFSALVAGIVTSDPFLKRQSESQKTQ